MANTSGDLYIRGSISATGAAPTHWWRRDPETGLLEKVPFTPEAPFIPGIHAAGEGSVLCDREPERDASILDPAGDQEYEREMKYGSPVPMRRCRCVKHRGRTVIPTIEFEEGDIYCRRCRRLIEGSKRWREESETPPKKQKWMRQMHHDKRRHIS